MSANYDIVAIGDCAIDAFVKVEEATLHCNINHENCEICFSFANKIPYESLHTLPAGNSNNVAVGMSRLGFKAAFYGIVGADYFGGIILDTLRKERVDRRLISVERHLPTNYHIVLWYKSERTILIKHQPYSYSLPAGVEKTNWIYFSSVGPKGLVLHQQVDKLLNKHRQIKMAFNPGTFQLRLGAKKLGPLFKRTEILFVNKEEAELLVGKKGNVLMLARRLSDKGPNIVVITDGLKGSYCLDQGKFYHIGIYPHKPFEATGAGDAYATGFTAAIMRGLPVTEALRWGGRDGASVATKIGPQAGLVNSREMLASLKSHQSFKAKLIIA